MIPLWLYLLSLGLAHKTNKKKGVGGRIEAGFKFKKIICVVGVLLPIVLPILLCEKSL